MTLLERIDSAAMDFLKETNTDPNLLVLDSVASDAFDTVIASLLSYNPTKGVPEQYRGMRVVRCRGYLGEFYVGRALLMKGE